ncbi:GTP-binding protein [Antrihabitans sp. YC3-6]|uniref:GTP-binding protein n=1 Tax=Antrihabitans stalagmiti TaxID=2799499 RepID=A0A934U4I2_9NOCA|nr:GTP-binding protein [Antrihabitans stalagmiti]MBJ8340559.1 GTP-binding protein [Antrihabitans stalagmiti]
MSATDRRTPVILVAGWAGATAATARSLLDARTVVVRHDLAEVTEGVVRRTVTTYDARRESILELAHGCVSCTLREDLLPLLRRLGARDSIDRIVLELDRTLEPEALCWAIENVEITGVVGQLDGPAARDVKIEAVLTCVDAADWLVDATGDDTLADRGVLASIDDDRTVAQLVVGQVDYADALVISGSPADAWHQAKLLAILRRLAPGAPITWVPAGATPDAAALLGHVPADARRGAVFDAHGPLLRGQPSLDTDCGVTIVEFSATRPFHPGRLHEAVDVLLDGVVSARGRVWVATQPDEALWLESAGGGLRVASAGTWLAAMSPAEQAAADPARVAMAAMRWDERFGDRDTSMIALVHSADPSDISRALQWALVTDDELADEKTWQDWADPFGQWHEDPCETSESPYSESNREEQA